uniref:Vacuole membrane protein 1 n=1 Tax=Panagrolaimus sp. ES5 TaxID=591445 RepID=A0AC34FXL1_9BILA
MGRNKKKTGKNGIVATASHTAKDVHFEQSPERKEKPVDYLPPSGRGLRPVPSAGALLHVERQKIVIWRRPFLTTYYFFLELFWLCIDGLIALYNHKKTVLITLFSAGVSIYLYYLPGEHQRYIQPLEKKVLWWLYWIGLGVLSSIGLGSGLHTFVLYLAPHIARVTLAAYECGSLNFPEPPYPDDVTCPETKDIAAGAVSLWSIISKVRIESLMWGAGTALGELPPYFVARGARISGEAPDDEDYKEFLALQTSNVPKEITLMDKLKLKVENLVKNTGFLAILLFASIPNPLFDFAGITCGHFLIPFWTFFGATLIGKALIKMHMQMFFVIFALSEHHAEHLIQQTGKVPRIGPFLQATLTEFLNSQKRKLHRNPGDPANQDGSLLQQIITYLTLLIVIFFLISIVNSFAQNYHKRVSDAKKKRK